MSSYDSLIKKGYNIEEWVSETGVPMLTIYDARGHIDSKSATSSDDPTIKWDTDLPKTQYPFTEQTKQ